MRQKLPALIISLLAAIFMANAINKAVPAEQQPPDHEKAGAPEAAAMRPAGR